MGTITRVDVDNGNGSHVKCTVYPTRPAPGVHEREHIVLEITATGASCSINDHVSSFTYCEEQIFSHQRRLFIKRR